MLRIRNHPSVGLYCGRNEGFPPPPLETGLRQILRDLHPLLALHSEFRGRGGQRTWSVLGESRCRFTSERRDKQLHSEIGAPNIPPMESLRHDDAREGDVAAGAGLGSARFLPGRARMGGAAFRAIVENSYGGANSAEEWMKLAQFVNYDAYRAMFEAQSKYRMGVLLWMSHSCWPSFVWQTYDYYFEPTAAYYGCKKGSEPLHIQWNSRRIRSKW